VCRRHRLSASPLAPSGASVARHRGRCPGCARTTLQIESGTSPRLREDPCGCRASPSWRGSGSMLKLAVTGAAGATQGSIGSIRGATTPESPDRGERAPVPVGAAAALAVALRPSSPAPGGARGVPDADPRQRDRVRAR
jgi:hypothetical protein